MIRALTDAEFCRYCESLVFNKTRRVTLNFKISNFLRCRFFIVNVGRANLNNLAEKKIAYSFA